MPVSSSALATLKELLQRHAVALSDVAFARRLDSDGELRADVQEWLAAAPALPADVEPTEWLSFEQMRHQRLLAHTPLSQITDHCTRWSPRPATPPTNTERT